ncbi:hypothetical protein Y032_0122g1102 [Ancylostoma ceylanicum]|uniref:Uncharacterized protein n=1 Tax=Ancylostoma ceylanicum TaxID=53326 RepID=A0A016TA42_9BILA|nr:hypothetical protein Y032_0122g1102 [Ancylostoma ceylanicum]
MLVLLVWFCDQQRIRVPRWSRQLGHACRALRLCPRTPRCGPAACLRPFGVERMYRRPNLMFILLNFGVGLVYFLEIIAVELLIQMFCKLLRTPSQ